MTLDEILMKIHEEAKISLQKEPMLRPFLKSTVLNHPRIEDIISHRISALMGCNDIPQETMQMFFLEVYGKVPTIMEKVCADILAVFDRDPACNRFIEPLLYFKGFHAIQTHRIAHWMWKNDNQEGALLLQSRSSRVLGVDIHPAAKFGSGLFFDHATGIVIGECTEIGNNVSILQGVTLGGSGKEKSDRHPKIGNGVLIGAGAKVLGNIKVGNCSRIAAGSVVTKDVKDHVTVAGVPAKIIGKVGCSKPSTKMDQMIAD